ncbi:MAG: ATP-binding protein [Acidobacteriota bacterium]
MRKLLISGLRVVLTCSLSWGTATLLSSFQTNRSVASLVLVLEVLAVASRGDWTLAVLTSVSSSLAFSWYFIESVASFHISSAEGAITFSTMLVTGLTGSHLAIRAQRRAAEAIRRREEMERLQRLGNILLASNTVAEAAESVVGQVVDLFNVHGARLRLGGYEKPFHAGTTGPGKTSVIQIPSSCSNSALELYGPQPSSEVQSALANLISLVLDRARGAEERARIEASQKGEELRNTVLNALAHNFKTPLTSIKAAASMLRSSSGLGSGPDRELAVVIDEEADRLELLIRESLNLARIEAHQENPRVEECSVADLVSAIHSRVKRYLGGREFIVDIPEDLPSLAGDRFLFEQMLMQVVDNAWKYSKPDSRIYVTASQVNSRLILTVQNEGNQISEEERAKIFGKFYRGAANRSQVEGTGLGLAIAKAIAEAHGGTIWLDSEPNGPAFRFSLPVGMTGETSDSQQNYLAHR